MQKLNIAYLLCLLAVLAIPAGLGHAGENGGVKVLYSFELEEVKAKLSKKQMEGFLVGKSYKGKIGSGWRVKDHSEELKLPDGHEGPVTVWVNTGSRDKPHIHLYRTGATQGKYAKMYTPGAGGSEIRAWKYIISYNKGTYSGLMAQPGKEGYHDIKDWFWQRYANFFDDALQNRQKQRDWSPYEYLRLDMLSEGNPAVIGVRAFDSHGPRINAHRLGLRTKLVVFKLPAGKQVTCEFPLGELARAGELDLTKMMGFVIRLNGFEGEFKLYMDNFRLVSKSSAEADAKLPLIKMQGEAGPFARPVVSKHTARDAEKMKRKTGPVEKLGPVTVFKGKGMYACFGGHFGASGVTYAQSLRRGCVAYDNDRLFCVYGGQGGLRASASFDGGKTWGGLQPGEKEPPKFAWGHYRATASSDATGDVYFVGTENCSSYHEGYGVLFRRFAMTGTGWELDRLTLISQNMRKCPSDSRAWRVASGRIFATWTDGWGGQVAKYSDDDGITWIPCKDASKPIPRPFHTPDLADLKKPAAERPAPPKAILPWPGSPVVGSILVPYAESVAVLGRKEWQIHDGEKWGPGQKVELRGCATVLGNNHIFRAVGGQYRNIAKHEKTGPLIVAEIKDGKWTKQTLEASGIGDVILTASGKTVFCFYVKVKEEKVNEVHYRRWKDGKWEDPVLLATEAIRINRLAAPMVSPPNYAAIWWDERVANGRADSLVRFAKVPNQ